MAGRFDDNNKRIHAQRKFAQGAAVLPSRESLREFPLQNPVPKEPEQVTPRICNDRAEDLLTKVCFKDWEIVPETMEMALKKAVVVLSDVMLKPLDAKQSDAKPPDAKPPEAAESKMMPFAVRKSASKVPLSQPDFTKKMARQNAKKKAATKGSNTSSTSKRKSLRCALKHITDGVESTSIDKPSSLSLRNRIIEKKTSVNKVKKIEMDNEASTKSKTKELSRVQNEPTSSKNIAPNYVKANKTIPYKKNKLNNVSGASVEKSFNDSDEEPLVKKVKKNNQKRVNMKSSKAIKSINQIAEIVVKSRSEEFPCETATDDVYEFREETESPILGKRQISATNIEPSESSNNDSHVLCSQSLCKPCAEIIDTGLNDILIHSIETVNRTESSDCMESNDNNENSGEHIQPGQNVNNTRVNDLIQIDIENCEPKLESDTELRAEIFIDEEDCNIENTMFVYEESSITMTEAPKEEIIVDSQELIFVMPPSPQITEEDIKSEDDIILVKNSQIPTIHLQTQLDTIMKQVADLKNTVELTSHKKTLKPTKNMLRTPVKPRQGRGKSKVQTENIPKILPVNDTVFPKPTHSANIVEAPVFMPTEEEFQDPFDYIEKITPYASQFGIARIIPPPNFKPECNLDNDVRFTSNKQFIHRMRSRWGPSTRDMAAITSYLKTQQISLDSPPIIGGLDADLPRLYQVVEDMGGVKQVMGKWTQVSRTMNIPKLIPNPKLQDMYLKYILPFVTLSAEEREEYFRKANIMWAAARATKKSRHRSNYSPLMVDMALPQDEDSYTDVVIEEMDCVTKGKVMNYAAFTKMCKNAMNMWFRSSRNKRNRVPEPSPEDVESQFWRIVEKADKHIVVHSASINTEDSGIGFIDPTKNVDVSTNHPWNLKVMCNNPKSVLRSMGTLMGVTIPTLHLGMVFSTSCWYRDPHGLPWIEFLHRGSPKIWYGLPESEGERLKAGFRNLAPFVCKNKKIWLPSDTTMIPPEMLRDTGVSLCRTVQNSGEYVLVFPKAYSSSICTGSSVSESVYLSTFSWLMTAYNDFEDLHGSCEPSLFSLEHLLISIAEDATSNNQLLMHSHSLLTKIFESEKENRGTLRSFNIPLDERPARCEEGAEFPALVRARSGEDIEECDVCKQRLHLSYLYDLNDDDQIFCLPHAIDIITKETAENYSNAVVHCKYSSAQLNTIMKRLIDRLTIHIGDQN